MDTRGIELAKPRSYVAIVSFCHVTVDEVFPTPRLSLKVQTALFTSTASKCIRSWNVCNSAIHANVSRTVEAD